MSELADRWYSPCGYSRGPVSTASSVELCPRCQSSMWANHPFVAATTTPTPPYRFLRAACRWCGDVGCLLCARQVKDPA
jgi:hypothetical protein